jgi:hypothetical protein
MKFFTYFMNPLNATNTWGFRLQLSWNFDRAILNLKVFFKKKKEFDNFLVTQEGVQTLW